jgi:hypothetical protein
LPIGDRLLTTKSISQLHGKRWYASVNLHA